MEQFIYAKKDIEHRGVTIRKYEVGTLDNISGSKYTVTFARNNLTIELDKSLVSNFDPKDTGDQCHKKVCNMCSRLLSIKQFEVNQTGKDNRIVRRPSCKDCRSIIDGVSMSKAEKNKMKEIKPDMEIWTCPICEKTTIPGLTSKVVIDHDHKTGHPRAWICDSCNTGLGRFKDDVGLLKRAIDYLESFEEQ